MQAEYVPTAVYLEFTFISTEELSFDPNQRHPPMKVYPCAFAGSSHLWFSQVYAENHGLVGF